MPGTLICHNVAPREDDQAARTENTGERLGVCASNPSSRGKGAAGRCEAAGSKKPRAYSLEYVEDFFEPRTTQMLADHLSQQNGITRTDS